MTFLGYKIICTHDKPDVFVLQDQGHVSEFKSKFYDLETAKEIAAKHDAEFGANVAVLIPFYESPIYITGRAHTSAREKLAKRGTPDSAIRIGVKGGGCSGYSYVIQFDDGLPKETDTVIDSGKLRFFVDKKSLSVLKGTILDHERTLMYEGFRFHNPQQVSECGCGQSFNTR